MDKVANELATHSAQADIDSVKHRLQAFRERDRDIDNQIERLERIEAKMTSVSSPILSDMPKSPSPSHDKIANMLAMKEELDTSIRQAVQYQEEERKEIERILSYLSHSDEKAVIRMRYLDGVSWNDVVDMLFGGKQDFIGKEDTYLRRTHKIHGSALQNMARVICANQDNQKKETSTP